MSNAASTLLTQSIEAFQSVAIGDNTVMVSVMDTTPIGAGTQIGGDYSATSQLWLFAEDVLLSGLKMRNGVIAANELDVVPGLGTLDVAGAAGTSTPIPNESAAPGVAGGDGQPGGALGVYVENASPYSPNFTINAPGGDGGAGQPGALNRPGANGGDGGKGGNVVVAAGIAPYDWLSQLRQIYLLATLSSQQAAITNLVASMPQDTELGAVRQSLSAAVAATAQSDFDGQLEAAAKDLQILGSGYAADLQTATNVAGGRYGAYGPGNPNGSDGNPGAAGALSAAIVGVPGELATATFPAFPIAHPSQCARLLEKAKLMYFALDPANDPSGVADLLTLLLRLQARTGVFVAAADGSPLVAYYAQNEASIGAVGSTDQMRAINDEVTRYVAQLKAGRDLFGYNAESVPLGSFGFYRDLLTDLVDNFKCIEQNYNGYFGALVEDSAKMTSVQAARDSQSGVKATATAQLGLLKPLAAKTASLIDGYQVTLPPLKQALDDAMTAAGTQIQDAFNFSFDAVVQGLSTLAFAPDSEFMILTQAGQFLYNGATQVTDDQGIPIRTSYIVSQIKAVDASVDAISEGYTQLDNGALAADDPAAGKLVADEQQVLALLSQIDAKFPSELTTVKTAFDNYIAQVQDRNTKILEYNAIVLSMLRHAQLIAHAERDIATLNDSALAAMSPDFPDLVTFVSRVYYAARSQVMETLDLTARAFGFWSLSDTNLLDTAYGGRGPAELDATALGAAQDAILEGYRGAVENFDTYVSTFPATSGDPGLFVEVSDWQLDSFKSYNAAFIQVPAATADTDIDDSAFAGMANVRVLAARAWIDGAKTADGALHVTITHNGRETIVSPSGELFSFSHDAVTKVFLYEIATGQVFQDATFGVEQSGLTGPSSTETYAALGPFTTWHVKADPALNKELDLSQVTGIRLEFRGTNLAFT